LLPLSNVFPPCVEIVIGYIEEKPVTSLIVISLPGLSDAGGIKTVRGTVVVIIFTNVAVLGI